MYNLQVYSRKTLLKIFIYTSFDRWATINKPRVTPLLYISPYEEATDSAEVATSAVGKQGYDTIYPIYQFFLLLYQKDSLNSVWYQAVSSVFWTSFALEIWQFFYAKLNDHFTLALYITEVIDDFRWLPTRYWNSLISEYCHILQDGDSGTNVQGLRCVSWCKRQSRRGIRPFHSGWNWSIDFSSRLLWYFTLVLNLFKAFIV